MFTSAWPASAESTGFTKDSYKVYEFEERVLIEVQAQGCCPAAQGQVDYYTSDGTAVAGRDYVHTAGTLLLAGGGRTSIRVPILNDSLVEEKKQFQVTLTNFRGTFSERGSETAVVHILDDDWTYSEPEQVIGESRPASPPTPPVPVVRNPASPAAIETVNESNEMDDDVAAPLLEAGPAAVRKDEEGRSSPSGVVAGMLLFLTVAAVAFGFRR
ncbi:MAG TPA: Calx-beta domain-containing protein [Actinomycetota bacterium]|nr:Calx-beta domain-containing protein [Actinomycetota bacterium]